MLSDSCPECGNKFVDEDGHPTRLEAEMCVECFLNAIFREEATHAD